MMKAWGKQMMKAWEKPRDQIPKQTPSLGPLLALIPANSFLPRTDDLRK